MRKFAALFVLGLCLFAPAFGQDESQRAIELYKQGDYEQALVLLDEAIASHPDWYFPIYLKAKCNLALKRYDKAIGNLTDTLTLEVPTKEVPAVKFEMARAYMMNKDYEKAIALFGDLVTLVQDSHKFDLFYNRGQCEVQIAKKAERSGDVGTAGNYYSKAIVSFSEAGKYPARAQRMEIEASFQKAYAQYKIGNFKGSEAELKKCLDYFEDVLKKDPRHQDAHRFLVEVGFHLAQNAQGQAAVDMYATTEGYLDRYLAVWPNDTKMLNKKGQALQGQKKYGEATEIFERYVRLKPNDGMGYFSLGSCLMADKKYEEAIENFKKALQKGEKDNHNIYYFTAYCYREQKTGCYHQDIPLYQKAVDVLNQGLKAIPNNGALKRDLQSTQQNLQVFRENLATDEENRKVSLDNIADLKANIAQNREKLRINMERNIAQPTAELQEAIEQGREAIRVATDKLNKELVDLKAYYDDAARCGGKAASQYFTQMAEVLAENGAM